ncbi:hypothetical protein [Sulfitobacter sp. M13]
MELKDKNHRHHRCRHGIGKAMAVRFAAEGAKKVGLCRSQQRRCAQGRLPMKSVA